MGCLIVIASNLRVEAFHTISLKVIIYSLLDTKMKIKHRLRSFTPLVFSKLVSRPKIIASWVAIIGGGIAFFFFYGYVAELMR